MSRKLLNAAINYRPDPIAWQAWQEARDDLKAALKDNVFRAIFRAYVQDDSPDAATLCAMHDRLVELGIDRHLDKVIAVAKEKRGIARPNESPF